MRKISFAFGIGIFPKLMYVLLYASESFFFRNTSIRNTVIMIFQKIPFILRREITIIWNSFIMTMCYKVHDVFFQIGAGTGNDMYFILSYHCLLYTSDAADERSSVDLG